jgi:hypothetical protein
MATVPDALQQRVDVACVPKVLEPLEHLKKVCFIALIEKMNGDYLVYGMINMASSSNSFKEDVSERTQLVDEQPKEKTSVREIEDESASSAETTHVNLAYDDCKDETTQDVLSETDDDTATSTKVPHGDDTECYIERIHKYIVSREDVSLFLLKELDVVRWLFADTSFLSVDDKECEDKWGRSVLKTRRPDLKLEKQWTNKFGEHIWEEVLSLLGKEVMKPIKKKHFKPDLEDKDVIWEVKTCTFHTKGTANEKIMGCAFKYAEIPTLYEKPLRIVCLGGAEHICRNMYGNLPGVIRSEEKNRFLEFYKENDIEFVGATDILRGLVDL